MRHVALAVLCALMLSACTPPAWRAMIEAGPKLVAATYVGFRATPQFVDMAFTEEWPELTAALKLHHEDEYWDALRDVTDRFRAGQDVSNPLWARFGHHALFASDESHRRVVEEYIDYLQAGMARDENFCFSDVPQSDDLAWREAIFDSITEGIMAPEQRPAATDAGYLVVLAYLRKKGLESSKVDMLLAGQEYPGWCEDFVIFLQALNHMDVVNAKVWRANMVALWAGIL